MIEIIGNRKTYNISLKCIKIGNDLNVMIMGGDIPHIGAIAIGQARKSMIDPKKISASTSVVTLLGHKEDELAKKSADLLAKSLNKTVVVTCGIHFNNITPDILSSVEFEVEELVLRLLDKLLR